GIRDLHVTGVQTCALPIFVLATVPPIASIPSLPHALRTRGGCRPFPKGHHGPRRGWQRRTLFESSHGSVRALRSVCEVRSPVSRSEERRVGKESSSRRWR